MGGGGESRIFQILKEFRMLQIQNYKHHQLSKIYIHHRIIVSIFSVIYNIIIFLYNRTGASDLAELQNTKEINGKYGCFANIVFLLQGLDH